MNLNDIIALAKSGYKKKDIDELLKLEIPTEEEETKESTPEEDDADSESNLNNSNDVEIDEKLKNALDKINELEEKLSKAQKDNVNKNNDNLHNEVKERNDRISSYAKNFM